MHPAREMQGAGMRSAEMPGCRLSCHQLVVVLLICAAGVGVSTAAHADALSIDFDWSGITEVQRQEIADLQENGRLPLPLIYVDGKPVGMMGESFDLPTYGGALTIDIGITKLLERPLYRVTWQADLAGAAMAEVTTSQLSAHDKDSVDRLSLILEGFADKAQVPVTSDADGQSIALPATAYLALARIVSAQNQPPSWLDWKALDVYQRDKDSGETVGPVFATFGPPKDVIVAAQEGALAQPYQGNVDVNWLRDFLPQLLTDVPEKLMLISSPGSADIYVSGTKQALTTDAEISAVRYLWPEIFIRREKYKPCQVDPLQVVPPLHEGEPSVFTCKLVKRK